MRLAHFGLTGLLVLSLAACDPRPSKDEATKFFTAHYSDLSSIADLCNTYPKLDSAIDRVDLEVPTVGQHSTLTNPDLDMYQDAAKRLATVQMTTVVCERDDAKPNHPLNDIHIARMYQPSLAPDPYFLVFIYRLAAADDAWRASLDPDLYPMPEQGWYLYLPYQQ